MVISLLKYFRYFVHVGLLAAWCVSIRRRILNRHVCSCLTAVGLLLIFWLILRTAKWEFMNLCLVNRFCWYAFYIPMILIPMIGVFVIQYLGKPDQYRMPNSLRCLWIPAVILIFLVFTNDWHRLVFDFPNGIEYYNCDYRYQPVFLVILIWIAGLGLYFAVMLIRKSRVSWSGFRWLPVGIMAVSMVFWLAYCMKWINCDIAVVNCAIIVLLCESAIQCGLIRSNVGYKELFYESDAMMQIVDQEYRTVYASHGALRLSEDTVQAIRKGSVLSGDIRIHSADIHGGHVIWAEDISEFNRLTEALKESRDRLDRKNELLTAELRLKEKQIRLEEQQRLYDRVRSEAQPRLAQLERLVQSSADEGDIRRRLSRICVIGAFIKRRSNLILLYCDGSMVPVKELEYCLKESAENLRLYGVMCALTCRSEGEIPAEILVSIYDYFEDAAEGSIEDLAALFIRLDCSAGFLKLTLQMGIHREPYIPAVPKVLREAGGVVSVRRQEDDSVLSLCIPIGGERT